MAAMRSAGPAAVPFRIPVVIRCGADCMLICERTSAAPVWRRRSLFGYGQRGEEVREWRYRGSFGTDSSAHCGWGHCRKGAKDWDWPAEECS